MSASAGSQDGVTHLCRHPFLCPKCTRASKRSFREKSSFTLKKSGWLSGSDRSLSSSAEKREKKKPTPSLPPLAVFAGDEQGREGGPGCTQAARAWRYPQGHCSSPCADRGAGTRPGDPPFPRGRGRCAAALTAGPGRRRRRRGRYAAVEPRGCCGERNTGVTGAGGTTTGSDRTGPGRVGPGPTRSPARRSRGTAMLRARRPQGEGAGQGQAAPSASGGAGPAPLPSPGAGRRAGPERSFPALSVASPGNARPRGPSAPVPHVPAGGRGQPRPPHQRLVPHQPRPARPLPAARLLPRLRVSAAPGPGLRPSAAPAPRSPPAPPLPPLLSSRRKPEPHPRYRTTNQAYGSKAPTVHEVPVGTGVGRWGHPPGLWPGVSEVASQSFGLRITPWHRTPLKCVKIKCPYRCIQAAARCRCH